MRFLLLCLGLVTALASNADGGVVFPVQSLSLVKNTAGPTTGSIDVFVTATSPDIRRQFVGAHAHVTPNAYSVGLNSGNVTLGTAARLVSFSNMFPLGNINTLGVVPGHVAASTVGGARVMLAAKQLGRFHVPFTVPQS